MINFSVNIFCCTQHLFPSIWYYGKLRAPHSMIAHFRKIISCPAFPLFGEIFFLPAAKRHGHVELFRCCSCSWQDVWLKRGNFCFLVHGPLLSPFEETKWMSKKVKKPWIVLENGKFEGFSIKASYSYIELRLFRF